MLGTLMPQPDKDDAKVVRFWRRTIAGPVSGFLTKLLATFWGCIIAALLRVLAMWVVAYAMAFLFLAVRDENRVLVVMAAGLGEVAFANIITLLWKRFRAYSSKAWRLALPRIRRK